MKLFKVLVLFSALLFSCIYIIWFTPLDDSNYLAAIKDKHDLLNTTTGKKIIFIGGSNLAFGLDSQLIEEKLGYHVVNMGLHAGLGIRYMINEVKKNVKENDLVILIPEYGFLFDGYKALLELVIFYPGALHYMDFRHYKTMLEKFPVTLQRRFKGFIEQEVLGSGDKRIHPVYSRKAFNQYGDVIGHLGRPKKKVLAGKISIALGHRRLAKIILHLNRFHEYLGKKKAVFFFSFPAIPDSRFQPRKATFDRLYNILKKNARFNMLGKPEDFVLPDDCFYDTIYHLNSQGRELRTLRIGEKLNHKLQKQNGYEYSFKSNLKRQK